MKKMKFFSLNNLYVVLVFLFGIFLCHYTGNRGVFPIDSFSHFDSGYRILNGEHPFRDYWIVSGFFIDYFQSIIFYFLGVNWQTYLLNASLLNGFIGVLVYFLLKFLGLSLLLSFFYSICFSILAYPSSGTPFVDHHSALLAIISIFMLIKGMKTNKLHFWFFIPIFLFLAFLSKQVPATYILFTVIVLTTYHLLYQKKNDILKIIFSLAASSLILVFLLILFFKINDIDINFFLTQYFYYPGTIGEERYKNINYDFKNTFLDFKYIYFSLLLLFFSTVANYKKNNANFYKKITFKIFLTSLLLFLSLAQHVIFTKNQIFIFFLIPLILGLANSRSNDLNKKYRKYFNIILIIFCIGVTLKYHQRFNIERKFHEFSNINFSEGLDSERLSKKFSGLTWITPSAINNEQIDNELNFLKKFKDILETDKSGKIVLTNYSFFSVLTEENVSGFSRWYPGDNSGFPITGNKYFDDYKDLILSVLKRKKIKTIYILPDVEENNFSDYVDVKCFNRYKLEFKIIKYEINKEC